MQGNNLPIDQYKGALLGLAVGDALGTTLEFTLPGRFSPINNMIGGGPFQLKPGQWTDDTSMALCLAESIIHCDGFDPKDQMERYLKWYKNGYLSSTGKCFDIGQTVLRALVIYQQTGNVFWDSTNPRLAGNGSIMRLAPVPLFYTHDFLKAIEMSGESSRTTHPLQVTIDACKYLGGLICGAVNGVSKEKLLSEIYSPVTGYWDKHKMVPEIYEVASGSFKIKNPPEIIGSGYVVKSLEAALWAFYNSNNFEEGVLLAVNLGNDADTTGAVYGQLAGAYYGSDAIPERFKKKIVKKDIILSFSEKLYNKVNIIS